MPSPATPPDGAPAHPTLHVSDTVVARVAAYHACRVPGVRRLRPDLAQSLTSIATQLLHLRDGEHRIPTDGVTATVENGWAQINITLVTQWGHNCRDIAEQVQDRVAEAVSSYTGLPATVSITITDVDYNSVEIPPLATSATATTSAGLATAENATCTWTVAGNDYTEQVLAAQRRFAEAMWVSAASLFNVARDITSPDATEQDSE